MILKELTSSSKINKELLDLVSILSLEDLISLKLDLVSKSLNGKLYGFPIWKNVDQIIRDSLIKYAVANTNSIREAAALLNVRPTQIKTFIYKYGLKDDFSEKQDP